MTEVRFVTVDVFTDRQFGGNPLAVVLDAEPLSTGQMQAIAAEFNLAETTFVLPPRAPDHTAQVRIFTPRAEIPFAGHPNVGTAFVLAREGQCYSRPVSGATLIFEELGGLVTVNLHRDGATILGAQVAAPQTLNLGDIVPADVVSRAAGLSVPDIERQHHEPSIASCGMPFVMAEVKDRDALARAQPRTDIFAERLPRDQVTGLFLYTHTPDDDADIQARMFAPLHGIPEDPATGAANVALIGLLANLRDEPELILERRIGQGVDMGRASLLEARAEKKDGIVSATFVGGRCVPVMTGAIVLR